VFGLEMTRRRAEQLAAQETRIRPENDADDERLRKAKARRAAVIAARVKETFGFEKESLFESDSYLRHYMARLLYRIIEAGEFDDNSYLLTCYDGVAEALDGAREVHQEERDAAQAAEAGAVADHKLAARNARMTAQKAKKILDEVKAQFELKLKGLQEKK
jgi:hypothetical protein